MSKFLLLLLFFVMTLSGVAFASHAVIEGRIVDSSSDTPMVHALITVEEKDIFMISDDFGKYEFWIWGEGDYTIRVERQGYLTTSKTVSVFPGANINLDLELEPVFRITDSATVGQDVTNSKYWVAHGPNVQKSVGFTQIMNTPAVRLSTSSDADQWCYYSYTIPNYLLDVSQYAGVTLEYHVESPPSDGFCLYVETADGGVWYKNLSISPGHHVVNVFFDDMTRYWQSTCTFIRLHLSKLKQLRISPVANKNGQDSAIYIIDISFFKTDLKN